MDYMLTIKHEDCLYWSLHRVNWLISFINVLHVVNIHICQHEYLLYFGVFEKLTEDSDQETIQFEWSFISYLVN